MTSRYGRGVHPMARSSIGTACTGLSDSSLTRIDRRVFRSAYPAAVRPQGNREPTRRRFIGEPFAQRAQATVQQVTLAYLLARSPVMLAIPGTGSIEHLGENMA